MEQFEFTEIVQKEVETKLEIKEPIDVYYYNGTCVVWSSNSL
jgi:hypothetical protein